LLSEVISIYPVTPASPMGEHGDDWAVHVAARSVPQWNAHS
jgi:pyruvate/2-oxoacid:ferredoxin oxidoreductase alpha subunit